MGKAGSRKKAKSPKKRSSSDVRSEAADFLRSLLGIPCDDQSSLVVLKMHIVRLHTLYWLMCQVEFAHSSLQRVVDWASRERTPSVDALWDYRDFVDEINSEFNAKLSWIIREAAAWPELVHPTEKLTECMETFASVVIEDVSTGLNELARNENSNGPLTDQEIFDKLRVLGPVEKKAQESTARPVILKIQSEAKSSQEKVNEIRLLANDLWGQTIEDLKSTEEELLNHDDGTID